MCFILFSSFLKQLGWNHLDTTTFIYLNVKLDYAQVAEGTSWDWDFQCQFFGLEVFILIAHVYEKFWLEWEKGGKTPFFSSYSMLDMVLPSLIFKTSLPGMKSYLYFIDR